MGLGWTDMGEWWIRGRECVLILDPRPHYCDRGNHLVHLEYWGSLARAGGIDGHDMWPRMYFNFNAALSEGVAWLKTRKQFIEGKSAWKKGSPSIPEIHSMRGEQPENQNAAS